MKNCLPLIALLIVACSSSKSTVSSGQDHFDGYKVYKIDSVKSVYLIYAKDDQNLHYKIVSRKENTASGEWIKVDKAYGFVLETIWSQKEDLVNGTYLYDTEISVEGDSILTLNRAWNLRGLKITKSMR